MIQRDLGDGTYASYDEDVPRPVLTEEQLEVAKQELKRREQAKAQAYHDEWVRKQREADERFEAKMNAAYPGVDADTRYSIYSDYRDYYD